MKALSTVLLWLLTATLHAAPKTVTLSVPTMNCPTCPITIKKALTAVSGVSAVVVRYENRQASVTFDDSRTTVEALTRAMTEAGYPSVLDGSVP